MIGGIVKMNVEIAGDEELMGCGSSQKRKQLNSSRKTENGLENADDRGGR